MIYRFLIDQRNMHAGLETLVEGVDPSPLILTNLQGQAGEPHWEGETVG